MRVGRSAHRPARLGVASARQGERLLPFWSPLCADYPTVIISFTLDKNTRRRITVSIWQLVNPRLSQVKRLACGQRAGQWKRLEATWLQSLCLLSPPSACPAPGPAPS